MNLDPKLYATRGYYPSKRTSFSVATRGFSFIPTFVQEYGIKLISLVTAMFTQESKFKTPIELESKI